MKHIKVSFTCSIMGVERCGDSTIGGQRKGRRQPIALDVAEIYNFIFLIIT